MGGCQSKEEEEVVRSHNPSPKKKKKAPHESVSPPITRKRIDSWAQHASHSVPQSINGSSTANGRTPNPIEYQWQQLWQTQASMLIDPVDVHIVLDAALDQLANKFTTAEATWIQRKVRASLRLKQKNNTKMRVLSSSSTLDSKALANSYRLIHFSVLNRLIPYSPVLDNLYTILQHLSESLWDRVQSVAIDSAKAGQLDMDVNHKARNNPPKPSLVPDITNGPSLPPGVTLQALMGILGCALRGTRNQRLQLLFYLSHPDLEQFLAGHVGGGVPMWLLEVDQNIVVSLASLTHYHYYGTAFLPTVAKMPPHEHSRSRSPIQVPSRCIQELVEYAWNPMTVTVRRNSTSSLGGGSSHNSTNGGSVSGFRRGRPEETNAEDDIVSWPSLPSAVTGLVWNDDAKPTIECHCPLLHDNDKGVEWTMDDFKEWADEHLSDVALAHVMHRLLGATLLPSPSLENDLVREAWRTWQSEQNQHEEGDSEEEQCRSMLQEGGTPVWGGIGGSDGSGPTGNGYMYCIDRHWWDTWAAYAEFENDGAAAGRPGALLTDSLLNTSTNNIPGTRGSYQEMREGLKVGIDYVLVPPPVWNILYELYGGGPPLPRIAVSKDNSNMANSENVVETHPMVIHVQLCDPTQPYRRGDIGTASIRIMAIRGQPLWRFLAEVLTRFPFGAYKAFVDGVGRARLWRHTDASSKEPVARYGPWQLLVQSETYALLPSLPLDKPNEEIVAESWIKYGNMDLDSLGFKDNMSLMLEFSVTNKSNELYWPREAAAKAGRDRQMADEDRRFREFLMGLDKDGEVMLKPPSIVGTIVDARDATGRWYPVKILQVDITDDETEHDDDGALIQEGGSSKKVMVDFKEFGGHTEWIDVESDRLATAGRCTSETTERQGANNGNGSSTLSSPEKKGALVVKKQAAEGTAESSKVCAYPGYGACGLSNLGNTCYVNSAVQCMSYLPLLRSYLLSSQYRATGDLNKDNPLGTGGKLLEEFADLLRSMWTGRVGEKSPTRFRSQLGKINSQFAGADQQDAQEFLNYMLDVLHEDSNKVRKKPYVEALEDDWVFKNQLSRVGEEAWRRFLRRNRSIMADVAMGQVLNTVTCPKCGFSSRNFDPFNLLSIPIPTIPDVLFKVTVYRRATPMNTPWVLNRVRKGDKRTARFSRKRSASSSGPPSDTFVAEEYLIAMFRMADTGDLKLKLQNLCGIPANKLRLCRVENRIVNESLPDHPMNSHSKVISLTEKDGPCSQVAKARQSEIQKGPTSILAFESSLSIRSLPKDTEDDTTDEEDGDRDDSFIPKPQEQKRIKKFLEGYGGNTECRFIDSDPLFLSKAISRSMWPRTNSELRMGLRVDARDKQGNWFPGSIVEVIDDEIDGGDADTGQEVRLTRRRVRVHFDNFASKWDEFYTIEHFHQRAIRPLCTHSSLRPRLTEFIVHHRCLDRDRDISNVFGQSFFLECCSEWSNARAGAHILAQASRFLGYVVGDGSMGVSDREAKVRRAVEKAQTAVSDLIDLLVDCDREYVKLALGLSDHSDGSAKAFRNPGFDATSLSNLLVRKVTALIHRLPFELRVRIDGVSNTTDEEAFPFSLVTTIGNYLNPNSIVYIQWRGPSSSTENKNNGSSKPSVFYALPVAEQDKATLGLAAKTEKADEIFKPGNSGMDLGNCLTEFCKTQNLTLNDNWRCPRCKKFREGRQHMDLWRLPDVLTFHVKRFNMSARWREKITTKVNFPLTGLNLSEWCHDDSPAKKNEGGEAAVYDLIGVVNHYGGMTGGHYVATCKATASTKDGCEEEGFSFNGTGTFEDFSNNASDTVSGWRLGSRKTEPNKTAAAEASKSVAESAEPLWLQFDDEQVEPIPPRLVVSDMAYVLFYRRRQVTAANIAKYSTLE